MTPTYKTIKRNYIASHGKPVDKEHTKIRRGLYKAIENNQDLSIKIILEMFENFGVTVELNDGVYCG